MSLDNTNKQGIIKQLFRKKCPDKMMQTINNQEHKLKKTLGAFDLTMLGIGAIVGAGIFTLAGTAAAGSEGHVGAGPALIISFIISGFVCGIAALCYAEFATMIPLTGSAYTYTYTTLGEIVAWIIGWILLFEYTIGNITVACGWSGYFFQLLKGYQKYLHLPDWLVNPPYWLSFDYSTALTMYKNANITPDFPMFMGIPLSINLPAIFIVVVITALLYIGVKESARTAAIMVIIKIAVILTFIAVGAFYIKPENWHPFMPNGYTGVFLGAFLVFFAYIGFDSVATAAEEAKNPSRDLPIGIISSLVICTIIYILVAGVLTGMVPCKMINTHAPIAAAMAAVNQNWIAGLISLGAVAGLASVVLVEQLAVTRISFAMSRDGLLPKFLSRVHKKYKTPHIITIIVGVVTIIGTLFLDINKAAELANVGTLSAFALVCIGIVILRYTDPNRPRAFRVPFVPVLPIIGALSSLGLIFYSLFNPVTPMTHARNFYFVWIVLGLIMYFAYSIKHSVLSKQ